MMIVVAETVKNTSGVPNQVYAWISHQEDGSRDISVTSRGCDLGELRFQEEIVRY